MKVRDTFHLYVHYVSIQVKSKMQYKASFFLSAMGQFLVSFNVFLGMLFLFMRFSAVAGFTYSQVLLCFSIFLMEFSLAECVGRGFDTFSTMVRKGEFDRVMVRPRGLVLQVLGSRFELTRFGRMLQALVMFVYGVTKSGIRWNGAKVMTVAFMLAGGTAVFFGIFLVYLGGSLCPGPALSSFISFGLQDRDMVEFCASSGLPLFDPLLRAVAAGGKAVSVSRVIVYIVHIVTVRFKGQ